MFSRASEYALRAIVWLGQHAEEGPVGNQRIAKEAQVPETYLAKILQQLTEAGLVSSRRGVGGGFALICDPGETTVLDVVNAVDPVERIASCPLSLRTHKKRRCSMHASLDEALGEVERVLSETTITDIVEDRSRPTPLVEMKRGER